jgi:hypothetical protein
MVDQCVACHWFVTVAGGVNEAKCVQRSNDLGGGSYKLSPPQVTNCRNLRLSARLTIKFECQSHLWGL